MTLKRRLRSTYSWIGWCKITNYLDYTETKILASSELKDFHIQLTGKESKLKV